MASARPNAVRLGVTIAVVLLVGLVAAWSLGLMAPSYRAPQNSLLVLAPYQYNGAWVFDDDRVGLVREPFVAGVPEMIDVLVEDIDEPAEGFRLTVSANPFPGYEAKLGWLRGDRQGNYYQLDEPPAWMSEEDDVPEECWICPALFKYYDSAPKALYVKADAI
ncbi:hypothetical protein MalM25_29420 [Planctomycetes bacterium MalM25]|nr:hypothetical protein MalM25_29420 [Planctomycetes bacterium MalM25]